MNRFLIIRLARWCRCLAWGNASIAPKNGANQLSPAQPVGRSAGRVSGRKNRRGLLMRASCGQNAMIAARARAGRLCHAGKSRTPPPKVVRQREAISWRPARASASASRTISRGWWAAERQCAAAPSRAARWRANGRHPNAARAQPGRHRQRFRRCRQSAAAESACPTAAGSTASPPVGA